jgi:hypothetical protein
MSQILSSHRDLRFPLHATLEELIHHRSITGTNLLDTRREIEKEDEADPRCKTPP